MALPGVSTLTWMERASGAVRDTAAWVKAHSGPFGSLVSKVQAAWANFHPIQFAKAYPMKAVGYGVAVIAVLAALKVIWSRIFPSDARTPKSS